MVRDYKNDERQRNHPTTNIKDKKNVRIIKGRKQIQDQLDQILQDQSRHKDFSRIDSATKGLTQPQQIRSEQESQRDNSTAARLILIPRGAVKNFLVLPTCDCTTKVPKYRVQQDFQD
jgi:hypothetical protein